MKHYAGHVLLKLIVIASFTGVKGQDIPIGTWRTHFSYLGAQHVVATENKIFCSSDVGFFSYEPSSGIRRKLSKLNGFSDVGISSLQYGSNALIVGYGSGYIDIVTEDGISVINDLVESTLNREKTIFDIDLKNERAYLGTGLGVIVIDISMATVEENYFKIGENGAEVNAYEVVLLNNQIFIKTEEGVQSGELSLNLLDFNNWVRFPGTNAFSNLVTVEEVLYASSDGVLYKFNEGSWSQVTQLPRLAYRLFKLENQLATISSDSLLILHDDQFGFDRTLPNITEVNGLAVLDGRHFLADNEKGLVNDLGTFLSPDGPASDQFSRIKVIDNVCYGFHAPDPFTYDGTQLSKGFSVFHKGSWSIDTLVNFPNVSDVDRIGGLYYFGSIGKGLFDVSNNEIITDLPQSSPEPDTMITSVASFDSEIWVSSFRGETALVKIVPNGSPRSYSAGFLAGNEIESIDVSILGTLWLKNDDRVLLLDPFQNLTDQITIADGIPSSTINDIGLSVMDDAWVVTSRGPATFFGSSFIVGNVDVILPSFENRFLFEDENLNAIITDGGNRVWFGSDRGLWIFDENTSELIARFTIENSPLPSNKILSMAYNGENGEVFIETEKGLVSYRSASSLGSFSHQEVKVYPNPVRPGFLGFVGIEGLASNANVKITDVRGNLVKEVDANGGTASWDLTNLQGTSVSSGIYYFFSSTSDGEETYVGKLAVIR